MSGSGQTHPSQSTIRVSTFVRPQVEMRTVPSTGASKQYQTSWCGTPAL